MITDKYGHRITVDNRIEYGPFMGRVVTTRPGGVTVKMDDGALLDLLPEDVIVKPASITELVNGVGR